MKEGRAIAEGQEVNTGCVSRAIQCICMCQVSAVTTMNRTNEVQIQHLSIKYSMETVYILSLLLMIA